MVSIRHQYAKWAIFCVFLVRLTWYCKITPTGMIDLKLQQQPAAYPWKWLAGIRWYMASYQKHSCSCSLTSLAYIEGPDAVCLFYFHIRWYYFVCFWLSLWNGRWFKREMISLYLSLFMFLSEWIFVMFWECCRKDVASAKYAGA